MDHQRVKSSNIYSLAHEGSTLEARFVCGECNGDGKQKRTTGTVATAVTCPKCSGAGHTGTYAYEHQDITPALFAKVLAGEPVENGVNSIGVAFNRYVKSKFRGVKR